ncbi:MAG TPA: zf-HC2 domain-containing protein [Humisphaera sp.]|jgi:anti-sigma factor RsiW|nr:zf-HC2 domain-containing protein [Humisphaera sp.]
MAECEFSTMLSPYYDGELSPLEHERVEQHILDCQDCALELERMHAISRALSTLIVPDAAPMLADGPRSPDKTLEEIALARFGRRMTAVAAAVLAASVIRWSFVSQRPAASAPTASISNWERAAIDPDPATNTIVASTADTSTADTQFDDFLARDLSGGEP